MKLQATNALAWQSTSNVQHKLPNAQPKASLETSVDSFTPSVVQERSGANGKKLFAAMVASAGVFLSSCVGHVETKLKLPSVSESLAGQGYSKIEPGKVLPAVKAKIPKLFICTGSANTESSLQMKGRELGNKAVTDWTSLATFQGLESCSAASENAVVNLRENGNVSLQGSGGYKIQLWKEADSDRRFVFTTTVNGIETAREVELPLADVVLDRKNIELVNEFKPLSNPTDQQIEQVRGAMTCPVENDVYRLVIEDVNPGTGRSNHPSSGSVIGVDETLKGCQEQGTEALKRFATNGELPASRLGTVAGGKTLAVETTGPFLERKVRVVLPLNSQ